jgi:hypothetical protein
MLQVSAQSADLLVRDSKEKIIFISGNLKMVFFSTLLRVFGKESEKIVVTP